MKLPPWKASCESDRQAMIDFVVAELLTGDGLAEEMMAQWDGTIDPKVAFQGALFTAKWSARTGDLKPLRKLLSSIGIEIAEFINEPRRVQGQRRPQSRGRGGWKHFIEYRGDRANDIKRVRRIWQRHYDGRWKRHASDGPSAEDIVDAYHAI